MLNIFWGQNSLSLRTSIIEGQFIGMGNELDMGDKEMGGIMNDIHLNKEVEGSVIYQNAMT